MGRWVLPIYGEVALPHLWGSTRRRRGMGLAPEGSRPPHLWGGCAMRRRGRGSAVGHVPLVPTLEREQRPQLLAVVPPAGEMFVDQPPDHPRVEIPLALDPLWRQDRQHLLTQRSAEPPCHRDAEALLGPVEDLVGQDAPKRSLQKELRPQPTQLQVERQPGGV